MNGADFTMVCRQTNIDGLTPGDTLYIKGWGVEGNLFAVCLKGGQEATVLTKAAFDRLTLGDLKFFGSVVGMGRSLA